MKKPFNILVLVILALASAWVLYDDSREEIAVQPLLMGGAMILLYILVMGITLLETKRNANNTNAVLGEQDKNYKPENPVRTYLGINNKQLFVGAVALISLALTIVFDAFIILHIGLGIIIAFMIIYRQNIVSDFQAVKAGDVPLMPAYSYEIFSWRSTAIILGILVVAAAFFIYYNL